MAVTISMTGSGTVGDISTGWSVDESATTVNPSESSGGTGSISMAAKATDTSEFVSENDIIFTHDKLGNISGLVGNVTRSGAIVGLGIAPLSSLLNAERNAPPTGQQPLSEIITGYVSLVSDQISVTYLATKNPVRIYPGWQSEVWYMLNQLAAVERVQITVEGDSIVVRDWGATTVGTDDYNSLNNTFNTQATGRFVEVTCQNTKLVASLGSTKYNYSQNPSVETNIVGWTTANTSGFGTFSAARTTEWAAVGGASYRAVVNTGGSASDPIALDVRHLIPVTAIADNETVSASVVLHTWIGNDPSTRGVRDSVVKYNWLNSANTVISTTTGSSVPNMTPDATTTNTSGSMAKPVGATNLQIAWSIPQFWYGSMGGGAPATYNRNLEGGDRVYMDAAILTNGSIVPYFDGNSPGATWTGTSNNSTSIIPLPPENDFYNAFTDNNTIYSVDSGEVSKTVVQTNNYPTYIAQPLHVMTFPTQVGTYYVIGSDNLPVTPSAWEAYGGKVEAAIGSVPGTIEITLTGPSSDIPGVAGPYSLAVSDGQNSYAALSIAGIGVTTNPETIRVNTGADDSKTTVEIAATLNSPFVTNIASAYGAAAWMGVDAAGPTVTISMTIPTNRLTSFGSTPGSLFSYKSCQYRVTDTSIGSTATSINAKWFVTADQMDAVWAGSTADQFDASWVGYSAADVQIKPLRK